MMFMLVLMDTSKAKPKKKMGRRPLPVAVKRIRIGCRITPDTKKFLDAMKKGSMGRAIDECVAFIKEAGIEP
jgi:hypothetical protein